jgi:hypothetical protein
MVKEHDLRGYIGLAEAGRISGFSLTRLRVLIDSGSLPGFRDPVGRRLVRKTAVLRLAARRTRTMGSEAGERTNRG